MIINGWGLLMTFSVATADVCKPLALPASFAGIRIQWESVGTLFHWMHMPGNKASLHACMLAYATVSNSCTRVCRLSWDLVLSKRKLSLFTITGLQQQWALRRLYQIGSEKSEPLELPLEHPAMMVTMVVIKGIWRRLCTHYTEDG